MTDKMIRTFSLLVDFLGGTLGPDYEVALYDLGTEPCPLVAIANGRISGQTIGSPLPEAVQTLLSSREYEGRDYIVNFTNQLRSTQKAIRSSALVLRDEEGRPTGLLGINFDDSRFLALTGDLLRLVHPDRFVEQEYEGGGAPAEDGLPAECGPFSQETIHNDVDSMMRDIFAGAARTLAVPADRLNQEERLAFVALLRERGLFRLKGAITYTAEQLGCSQATLYRYLGRVKNSPPQDDR